MNVGNIQEIIDTLKMSESKLNMFSWQSKSKSIHLAKNTEELHFCGMAACLGGYVAISERFIKAAGKLDEKDGSPIYNCRRDSEAVAEWFGISYHLAERICCMKNLCISYGVRQAKDVTKEMVINKLESIINKSEGYVY